jgi:hypothetical protein
VKRLKGILVTSQGPYSHTYSCTRYTLSVYVSAPVERRSTVALPLLRQNFSRLFLGPLSSLIFGITSTPCLFRTSPRAQLFSLTVGLFSNEFLVPLLLARLLRAPSSQGHGMSSRLLLHTILAGWRHLIEQRSRTPPDLHLPIFDLYPEITKASTNTRAAFLR